MAIENTTLAQVYIDEALAEEFGVQVEIDAHNLTQYLVHRELSEPEIADTSVSVVSYPEYSHELGKPILGSYCAEEGVVLHGLTIATRPLRGMRRRRPDRLTPLRPFWENATLSDRFNYVLLHELEHRIDRSKGVLFLDRATRQTTLKSKEHATTIASMALTHGLTYFGLELLTEPHLAGYMVTLAATAPLGAFADMQVAKRLHHNEYLTRPHEQRAHLAGLQLSPKLVKAFTSDIDGD